MLYLLDTNILLRGLDRRHPHLPDRAPRAGSASATKDATLPRGTESCGILGRGNPPGRCQRAGMSCAWAAAQLVRMTRFFVVLAENADVQPEWERLVAQHSVSGKKVHAARPVATMNVHQVSRILTFNTGDFSRYPGVTAINPSSVGPAQ
jgi:hypothetical protein